MENKWYESEQRKEDAFFKDLSSSRSKETIIYFPKIYYRMKQGLLHIRVEITLGKYQEQLLNLERKLESGLYCELTDKELKDSYVEYTLLYDTIANRISIEDVQAKDGRLRLMENVWWEYDKLPHMLIAGGTGGGKTYFILTLIEALLRTNAVLFVLDPKNADLADLQAVMPEVYYKKEDILVYSFCCRTVVGIQVFVCHKVNVRTQQISQTLAEVEANRHTARKNGRQVYLATAVTHQRYSRWSRTQV